MNSRNKKRRSKPPCWHCRRAVELSSCRCCLAAAPGEHESGQGNGRSKKCADPQPWTTHFVPAHLVLPASFLLLLLSGGAAVVEQWRLISDGGGYYAHQQKENVSLNRRSSEVAVDRR